MSHVERGLLLRERFQQRRNGRYRAFVTAKPSLMEEKSTGVEPGSAPRIELAVAISTSSVSEAKKLAPDSYLKIGKDHLRRQ
jgi:hypothetical protein